MRIGALFELLNAGGIFMYALLVSSIIGVTVMIQRTYTLFFQFRLDYDRIRNEVQIAVRARDYGRAMQLCAGRHPLQQILNAALLRANRSEKEIRRGIETAAVVELARFRRGTAVLPQISNLATLLGLLGTIHGLIISFSGMRGVDAAARQAALSKGVAVAFYNTFFGLSVAVVTIAAFLIVNARQGRDLTRMEHTVSLIVDEMLKTPDDRSQPRTGFGGAAPAERASREA